MKKRILMLAMLLPLCAFAQNIIHFEPTPEMIAREQETVREGSYGICVEAGNKEKDCKCFSDAIIEKFPRPIYFYSQTQTQHMKK